MPRKSTLKEILSFAIHHDGIDGYTITYRDFDTYKEISLADWLELSAIDSIPQHRISTVKKNEKILFQRIHT
jgi:uncharacterized protein (UPF0248 family)